MGELLRTWRGLSRSPGFTLAAILILAAVLRSMAGSVALGAACGLALAATAGRALQSVLYGIAPADPATLATATLVLGASALLAADLPARRAARIDPSRALRQE